MLKTTAFGVAGGIGAQAVGTATAASGCPDADPNKEWSDHANFENAKGQNEGIYLSTDIGNIGASYDDTNDVWEYRFKQSTVGRSEYYPSGDSLAALQSQEVGISLGTCYDLQPSLGDCFLGCRPDLSSGDGFDYAAVAKTIAETAVGNINKYTEYSVTAYSLVHDLMYADQGDESSEYTHHRLWDYYSNSYSVHDEVSNYCYWESVADGEDYFDVMTRIESVHDNNPELLFSFKIYNGYSPQRVGSTSTFSTNSGREMVSYSPDQKPNHNWQVERIPHGKIRQKVRNGDIFVKNNRIERHENEGKPLYWAHNPPAEVISVSKQGGVE